MPKENKGRVEDGGEECERVKERAGEERGKVRWGGEEGEAVNVCEDDGEGKQQRVMERVARGAAEIGVRGGKGK